MDFTGVKPAGSEPAGTCRQCRSGKIELMNILFLTRYFYPHIGGVEKQVLKLSQELIKRGHQVTVITLKHDSHLKNQEIVSKIKIIRIPYLKMKYSGLLAIWLWLFKNIRLLKSTDIIHAHSVLIWYWPLRLLLPKKPVYVTFHGWEGIYPIPKKNILIRKIDAFLAWKNITIGDYVVKHYRIKADKIMYAAVDLPKQQSQKKDYRRLIYVGRLDPDTGLEKILQALSYLKGFTIDFCGGGPLADECKKFGMVHGFVEPNLFLAKAFICLSPGGASILEAFTYKCLIITTYNNPVKKDYLLMTPFASSIIVKETPSALAQAIKYYSQHPSAAQAKINQAYAWVKTQNWEQAVKLYLKLWQQ